MSPNSSFSYETYGLVMIRHIHFESTKDQFISVMEVINYFCAHDMEHFKKAGEFLKGKRSQWKTKRILLVRPYLQSRFYTG